MTRAEIERRRLTRIINNAALSPFERETAQSQLAALNERIDPTCRHCLAKVRSHNGAVCPVLDRYRRKHGRDTFPSSEQSAEIRARMAENEAEKLKTERRQENKGRQQKLF